jgi:hypothetical protein
MREHIVNKENNFIGGWYLEDTSICDAVIAQHEVNPDRYEGVLGPRFEVDKARKDSIDSQFCDKGVADKYYDALQKVLIEYMKKYPMCNAYSSFRIVEAPNIQHYKPNGGYFAWHTERGSNITPYNARHLVFMTYLNDVADEGETEFFHQQIKIRPEKGLTLIWPADWTFTHRGIASPTQDKYIVTGWYSFNISKLT